MTRILDTKYQERTVLAFDHPAVTASTTWKVWKVPAGKSFVLDRASYINPTGLVEDTTNVYDGAVLTSGQTSIVFVGEADDDTATAVAHGLVTGMGPYQLTTSSSLPTGLTPLTNYWVIRTGADTFQFASSYANAIAGTAIALTTDGAGTNTLITTILSRLFNTDSNLSPDIGASLAADTFVEGSVTGTAWLAAGDIISLVATKGGTQTLPAGRLILEGRLV